MSDDHREWGMSKLSASYVSGGLLVNILFSDRSSPNSVMFCNAGPENQPDIVLQILGKSDYRFGSHHKHSYVAQS